MPQQLHITKKQTTILEKILRRLASPQSLVLRAKIVLAGAEYGRRDTHIADDLDCHARTVGVWRHRWLECCQRVLEVENVGTQAELELAIIKALSDLPRLGAPAKFTAEQICQIISVACEVPSLSERPITEWTPRELADEVIKRRIVESISRTQAGRFLKMRPI